MNAAYQCHQKILNLGSPKILSPNNSLPATGSLSWISSEKPFLNLAKLSKKSAPEKFAFSSNSRALVRFSYFVTSSSKFLCRLFESPRRTRRKCRSLSSFEKREKKTSIFFLDQSYYLSPRVSFQFFSVLFYEYGSFVSARFTTQ